MQTFPSSETVVLASNSPPVVPGGDDVDIDFGDVFGGPPKRRSKVNNNNNQVTRHSFSETALRRRDAIVDDGDVLMIPRDAVLDERDEKPVFGEESSVRRRFTADDFFDDIFRVKKEQEPFGSSLPGSRILSPAHKAESSGTSFPSQFSLPAKATEIPTFGSVTRSLSKNKETAWTSPLSRTSSKADTVFTVKSELDDVDGAPPQVVVTGKGRQFHFSIYKWPNKGVPVVIWGSSRLSSMSKAEVTTSNDPPSVSVEKTGKYEEVEGVSGLSSLKEEKKISQKRPVVQTKEVKTEIDLMSQQVFSGVSKAREANVKKPLHSIGSMSEQAFSDVSKTHEANVKPLHSMVYDNVEIEGEDIVLDREVRKGKSRVKNMRSSTGDSRTKKKPQSTKGSLDSRIPDKSRFASSSSVPEVGKDGAKGKVMDFVKIFSQGAGGESLGKSSRWRAKETPKNDINHDGANAEETVNIRDQQKKLTPDIPAVERDQKPSQATQKKDSDRKSVNGNKTRGVTEKEEIRQAEKEEIRQAEKVKIRQEPVASHTTSEDIDEPIHVNFMVEDITQEENKQEEIRNEAEEIQNIDAKIRKWSSGKSGNIRSLLSTLQYILWPGSGWKAIPLMDMIEGNAVRKSYQRALLILHPDKLQQKGASANQKYMAEKVFELLQEAWDHFNTLGPV